MSSISVRWAAITSTDDAAPVGINVASGAVAIVVAAFVAAAIPLVDGGWRWAILDVVVGGFAALTADGPALTAVVGLAWLVGNGFLVDRAGELSWHGWADASRLLVLIAAGVAGLLAGALSRLTREWRELARVDADVRRMVLTMNDEEKQRA
jgi:hypothetical protein